MACENCGGPAACRTDVNGVLGEVSRDLDQLERVERNQGFVLIALAVIVVVLLIRLNDKGILSYKDLLDAPVG